MVLRDAEGLPFFSACRFSEYCEAPLEAEIRACMEGLSLALQHSQLPVIVEIDCSQVVAATTNSVQDRSPFVFWVVELRALVICGRVCTTANDRRFGLVMFLQTLQGWNVIPILG
jgi:hypothetical protein